MIRQLVKKDKMKTVLLSMLIIIALTACSTHMKVRAQFDESINQYTKLMSAQNFDGAGTFAAEALAKEFRARAKAAKNIKVVDYRTITVDYNEEKGKAEVEVEIDYYSLSAYRLKTITDVQKWEYVIENSISQWRLMSLLPEFP